MNAVLFAGAEGAVTLLGVCALALVAGVVGPADPLGRAAHAYLLVFLGGAGALLALFALLAGAGGFALFRAERRWFSRVAVGAFVSGSVLALASVSDALSTHSGTRYTTAALGALVAHHSVMFLVIASSVVRRIFR